MDARLLWDGGELVIMSFLMRIDWICLSVDLLPIERSNCICFVKYNELTRWCSSRSRPVLFMRSSDSVLGDSDMNFPVPERRTVYWQRRHSSMKFDLLADTSIITQLSAGCWWRHSSSLNIYVQIWIQGLSCNAWKHAVPMDTRTYVPVIIDFGCCPIVPVSGVLR